MSNCDRDHSCCLGFEIFHNFTSWETQTADCHLNFSHIKNIRAAKTKQDLKVTSFNFSLDIMWKHFREARSAGLRLESEMLWQALAS